MPPSQRPRGQPGVCCWSCTAQHLELAGYSDSLKHHSFTAQEESGLEQLAWYRTYDGWFNPNKKRGQIFWVHIHGPHHCHGGKYQSFLKTHVEAASWETWMPLFYSSPASLWRDFFPLQAHSQGDPTRRIKQKGQNQSQTPRICIL